MHKFSHFTIINLFINKIEETSDRHINVKTPRNLFHGHTVTPIKVDLNNKLKEITVVGRCGVLWKQLKFVIVRSTNVNERHICLKLYLLSFKLQNVVNLMKIEFYFQITMKKRLARLLGMLSKVSYRQCRNVLLLYSSGYHLK